MIVDYVEGNKWLKAAMNPQYRLYMSQDDIAEIIHDNRVCGFSSRYFDENNKDITFYKPFFAAIQDDIYEFVGLSYFGSLRMRCYWPYNENIEADTRIGTIITQIGENGEKLIADIAEYLKNSSGHILSTTVDVVSGTFGVLVNLFMGLIFAIYIIRK